MPVLSRRVSFFSMIIMAAAIACAAPLQSAKAEGPALRLHPVTPPPAAPAPKPPAHPAQEVIDACWQGTEMDRNSGVKTRMVAGANRTIECLRKEILKQAATFKPDDKKDFTDALGNFISQSSAVNWLAYNGACGTSCGTDAHLAALTGTAEDLERILKATYGETPDNPHGK